MPILVICIVISFAFYLFYKVKYVRSRQPIERKWISTKSSIALGIFVLTFGLNQLFLFQTTVTYIVAAIFIVIGAWSSFNGWKAYMYFTPLAIKEAESLQKN